MNAHRSKATRRGTAAVEFALWLPILFLLISGVVDWSSFMSTRVHIERAVTDGCRTGASVIEPVTSPEGSVAIPRAESRMTDVLTGVGLTPGGATMTAQFCNPGDGGNCGSPPIEALYCSIQFPFVPFFGLAGAPGIIDADYIMAMEVQR